MSDYISIKDDRFWEILFDEACVEGKQAERIKKELEKITLDEKEIIRKAFERVLQRLDKQAGEFIDLSHRELSNNSIPAIKYLNKGFGVARAIEIVKEECGISE